MVCNCNRDPVVTYHLGLPNIGGLLRELQPVLHSSIRCKDAIKEFPVVSFRKPKSLSEYSVRASFRSGSKDKVKGTSKCNSNGCQIYNFLCLERVFRNNKTGKEFSINYDLNCNSRNVIDLITCSKCKIQYVGSTTTAFRTRFNNHKSRVNAHVNPSSENKKEDDVLYQHFHSQGHLGLEHMSIQLIDWVKGERELRDKEGQWIYKLGTLLPHGLNDNDGI